MIYPHFYFCGTVLAMKRYSQEDLIEMLKEAEFRVTDHRLAVLTAVAKAREPVTVYTLFDALRKKHDIDQATVYRNLSSLHEAGLLRRLDFNHGHAHYELETGESSSQLVCSKCETIEKIDAKLLDDVIRKAAKKSKKFKTVNAHTVEVYGTCKSCS